MNPYLIQRAKFVKSDKKGIDSILRFDYMGSAEFEWDALPKSLDRIRKNSVNFSYNDLKINGKEITVYSDSNIEKITEILIDLSHDKIRLKERSDFKSYVRPSVYDNQWIEKHGHDTDFWWDIENDFMFWKKDSEFAKNFKMRIANSSFKNWL